MNKLSFNFKLTFLLSFSAMALLAFQVSKNPTKDIVLTIGTGGKTGVYYPTGIAITQVANRERTLKGIKFDYTPTTGSVFNINALSIGDIDFGIIQSDKLYQAWMGTDEWGDRGSQTKLRSICSLYPESVVLLVREDSGIKNIYDLHDKRINIGHIDSGARANALDLLDVVGLNWIQDIIPSNYKTSNIHDKFQTGEIDGFIHTIGHPNDFLRKISSEQIKCSVIPIEGEEIEKLIHKWPFYDKSQIPINFYPNLLNDTDINTFGVRATLCTSDDISDEIVYELTAAIFENLEILKKKHPVLETLHAEKMLSGLSAPLHNGSVQYYSEIGLTIPEHLIREER